MPIVAGDSQHLRAALSPKKGLMPYKGLKSHHSIFQPTTVCPKHAPRQRLRERREGADTTQAMKRLRLMDGLDDLWGLFQPK